MTDDEEKRALGQHQEYEPTKVKIPKLPKGMYTVYLFKTIGVEVAGKKTLLTMKPQVIGGYSFPKREIYTNYAPGITYENIFMSDEELNAMLRIDFFDKLRTIKRK